MSEKKVRIGNDLCVPGSPLSWALFIVNLSPDEKDSELCKLYMEDDRAVDYPLGWEE